MLTLPIKKKWFDMIKFGEKKEEYREIKPYYTTRFYGRAYEHNLKNGFIKEKLQFEREIIFRNGYSNSSPTIKCKILLKKGYGKKEWGAKPNKLYYVLKILNVEEVK